MSEKQQMSLLDAQAAVLGCMLIDERTIGPVLSELRDEDFPAATYRMIFSAIRQQFVSGTATDIVTIADRLGGAQNELLAQLMQVTPTAAHVKAYVGILRKQARLQRLRDLAQEMLEAEDEDGIHALLDQAMMLAVDRPGIRSMTMAEALKDFYERHDPGRKPDFLPWTLEGLDDHVKAEPGDMVIIGARPSVGKTVLAAQFAVEQATRGKRVGFFSLETSDRKLHDRIMANRTGIPLKRMQENDLTPEDWDTVAALSTSLATPPLEIIDAAGWSVSDIRTYALAKRFEIIYIDYLQKVQAPEIRDAGNEFARVTYVSNALQRFGRESDIAIVALSQLSRQERTKGGKVREPDLSDLRSSGQIEQDAQVIMLMCKEEPNNNNSRRLLKVAKNKDGEADLRMWLVLDGEAMKFTKHRESREWTRPQPVPKGFEQLAGQATMAEMDAIFGPEKKKEGTNP